MPSLNFYGEKSTGIFSTFSFDNSDAFKRKEGGKPLVSVYDKEEILIGSERVKVGVTEKGYVVDVQKTFWEIAENRAKVMNEIK